jgi:glutathione synthase/RimK-type ligase-like ATP-grasp enzyme
MNRYVLIKNRKYSIRNADLPTLTIRELERVREPISVVRWGCTKTHPMIAEEIQDREAIIRASNKPLARDILLEHGLPCPRVYSSPDEAKWPCMGRKVKTRGGQDIKVFNSPDEYDKRYPYLQEIVSKVSEYRVHVMLNRVLLVQEKDPVEFIAWNHANGSTFRVLRWSSIPRGLNPLAIKAVKALGLVFGAVDIGLTKDGYTIFEVNTAPGIDGYTIERWRMGLIYLIENGAEYLLESKKTMWRHNENSEV